MDLSGSGSKPASTVDFSQSLRTLRGVLHQANATGKCHSPVSGYASMLYSNVRIAVTLCTRHTGHCWAESGLR